MLERRVARTTLATMLRAASLALLAACALAGCGSNDDRSTTASAATTPEGSLVWAIGDGGTDSRGSKAVADRILAEDPDRVLYLGDVYDSGTPAEFTDRFAVVFKGLLERMDPTPGNHEWGQRRIGYFPFWRLQRGKSLPPWYRTGIGGWRIYVLNSEAAHEEGSAQLAWLKRQLRTARGTCGIGVWHRPRFSAGPHGDADDVEPLWDALRGHAKLVVSAHDHGMQRFRPAGGLTQVVSGAGGNDLYPLGDHDRLAFGDDRSYGGLRLRLRRGRADLAFVTTGGRVLDRSTVRCAP